MSSSTPITVTLCRVFQFAGVKTSEAGDTVPSLVSELDTVTVTSAFGLPNSTISMLIVPPASVVFLAS